LFVGCLFLLLGFGTLHAGRLQYQNWFGQSVFPSFAAAIGFFVYRYSHLLQEIGGTVEFFTARGPQG